MIDYDLCVLYNYLLRKTLVMYIIAQKNVTDKSVCDIFVVLMLNLYYEYNTIN